MGRLLALESFAGAEDRRAGDVARRVTDAEIETFRLEGYDAGYRAGWDDAAAAHAQDQDRIGEEFARNLRDLGFSYHEARAHVTAGVDAVLRTFLKTFFPAFLGEAIAAHVEDALAPHVDRAAGQPIRLRVSPQDTPALGRLLVSVSTLPCHIEEEPSLARGQVYFSFGAHEAEIDLSSVIEATESALDALNDINERTLGHG
jgi:flagellar assembly protein FliH